jgi:sec-independent protein translocase protein TatC
MTRRSFSAEMPFLDHLEELRWRLLRIAAALLVGLGAGLALHAKYDLPTLLIAPACPYIAECSLQALSPMDAISIPFTLAFWAGVVLASPVIIHQVWAFVSPALHPRERRAGAFVLSGGLALFVLGAALAYLFVLPATLEFAQDFGGASIRNSYAVGNYFSMVVTLILTFGISFELPIAMMAAAALRLVTPAFLRKYRRHALVLCVAGAAVMTPSDAITATVMLVAPLYCLYEIGILLSVVAYRWSERRDAPDVMANDGMAASVAQ